MKTKAVLVTAAASMLGAGAANAVTGSPSTPTPPSQPTLSTYFFTGSCLDCSPTSNSTPASATLDLQNYTPGQALSYNNLVDLTYTSAKVGTLTFTSSSAFASLTGNLGSTAGAYGVSFSGKTTAVAGTQGNPPRYDFITDTSGNFSLSQEASSGSSPTIPFNLDVGTNGTWSPAATNAVSAAPEPESWALMLGGVAAMGAAIRASRRRRPAARAA